MSLRGLPDFGSPVLLDGGVAAYHGFAGAGPTRVLPCALGVARRTSDRGVDRPDLVIQRFRPERGDSPPPHALLTVGVDAEFPLADVLDLLRAEDPRATVAPASLGRGTITLALADRTAVTVPWDGLASTTWSIRLSVEDYHELRATIESGFSQLVATATVSVVGVAARCDTTVVLEPARLARELSALADVGGTVHRNDLVAWVRTKLLPTEGAPESALLEVAGATPEDELTEALADRLRAEYDLDAGVAAEAPGRVEWQLCDARTTTRTHTVTLPLFDSFDEIARDIDAHIPPGTEVPPLPLGWRVVEVSSLLPTDLEGVFAWGVHLTAPPRPPARPQAVTATVDLTGTHEVRRATLRLSPGEDLDLVVQPWALVEGPDGVQEVTAPELSSGHERLVLGPDDFPVRFVSVAAEPALLGLADVIVTIERDGVAWRSTTLTATDRPATLAQSDRPAQDAVTVLLRPHDGGDDLRLGPFAPGPIRVTRHQLPSWGPHQVEVSAALSTPEEMLAVELRPEGADEGADVLALTPTSPHRTWRYFAANPFRAGYQYRLRPAGAAPGTWSAVRAHDESVVIGEQP